VLTAIFISFFLIGFAALVVDVGFLYATRRNMQTAADAAAVAGSNALKQSCGTASSCTCESAAVCNNSAQDVATINGYANGTNAVSVTAKTPTAKPNPSDGIYVEVDVARPVPTYFLRTLGYNTVNVGAKAVAGYGKSPGCVFGLDSNFAGTINVQGSADITADCGIIDDSTSGSALTSGGAGKITATSIGVVGGASCGRCSPTPVTGIASVPDPLSAFAAPAITPAASPAPVNGCNYTNLNYAGGTLSPGVYCGGIRLGALAHAILNPGTYILMGGGLNFGANSTIAGTGVTFYNTFGTYGGSTYAYGPINIGATVTANLSAPTSGPMEGMLFFQDRSVPPSTSGANSSTLGGNASSTFDGDIYFSTTKLSYSGNSSTTGYTEVVAYVIDLGGNGSMTIHSNTTSLSNGPPITTSRLYE
jgi:Flp pilus assembly protein TadG